jgi:hypothetical protein
VSQLAALLEGTLGITLSKGSCDAKSGNTLGPTLVLALREKNANPKTYAGAISLPFESPGAYVELPMQPLQLAAVVLVCTGNAEYLMRLTFVDDAELIIPLQGLYLQEHKTSNLVKKIELQGSGEIAWHASGPLEA